MSDGVPAFSRPAAKSATSAPSLMDEPAVSAVHRSSAEPLLDVEAELELVGLASALLAESLLPPQPAATPPSESRAAAIRACFMRFGPLLDFDMGKLSTLSREPEESLSGAGRTPQGPPLPVGRRPPRRTSGCRLNHGKPQARALRGPRRAAAGKPRE